MTGSGPLQLNGSITLCARADLMAGRFFDGSLAHLAIYDEALTPEEMQSLYTAVRLTGRRG